MPVSAEEEGLEFTRRGMRFRVPEAESEFRQWHIIHYAATHRAGVQLAIAGWLGAVLMIAFVRPEGFLPWAALVLGVHVPLLLSSLYILRTPRLYPWHSIVMTVAFTVSGALAIGITNWHYGARGEAIAAFCISAYFSFVIARVPPIRAAVGVALPVLFEQWILIDLHRGGEIDTGLLMFDSFLIWLAFGTGLLMCVANDVEARRTFRQERIVERQKETIARERARSEMLLKQEVGHQVAARSRELGRMLASVDATLVAGRPKLGERFATRYRVERELGAGGMGTVYEVVRTTDGERLALKVITGEVSGQRAARFAREAEIGARIRHPNVVSIVDVGVAEGVPFLAMELAPRGSLEDRRERFGDAAWARPILVEIAAGLAALHDAGVVHRDLKPANVLLTGSEHTSVAKISDFGISRFGDLDTPEIDPLAATAGGANARAGLTATGMLLGTPLYMAPEATHGGAVVDARADIFAFGILACEMLTGKSPFAIAPFLLAMTGQPISAPSGLDDPRLEGVREMLASCLEVDPAKRPTMRATRETLDRLARRDRAQSTSK